MVGVLLKLGRDVVFDGPLDRIDIGAGGNTGAVSDAEDMGINRLRWNTEQAVQHHIRGLTPNPRQRHQRRARGGNLAAEIPDQDIGQLHHILRLLAEKADGLDFVGQPFKPKIKHLLRRRGQRE